MGNGTESVYVLFFSRYYVQYLSGYDAVALNQAMQARPFIYMYTLD